jgi:hypothetical protein
LNRHPKSLTVLYTRRLKNHCKSGELYVAFVLTKNILHIFTQSIKIFSQLWNALCFARSVVNPALESMGQELLANLSNKFRRFIMSMPYSAVKQPPMLTTPLEIYQAVVEHFPCGRIEIIQTEPVMLGLSLSPSIPKVILSHAVDKRSFSINVQSLAQLYQFARAQKSETALSLDPSRFSTTLPLTGWQAFNRAMYEQRDAKCENLILQFLKDPNDVTLITQLEQLGLAPSQVTEKEKKYFQTLMDTFSRMDVMEQEFFMVQFKKLYGQAFKEGELKISYEEPTYNSFTLQFINSHKIPAKEIAMGGGVTIGGAIGLSFGLPITTTAALCGVLAIGSWSLIQLGDFLVEEAKSYWNNRAASSSSVSSALTLKPAIDPRFAALSTTTLPKLHPEIRAEALKLLNIPNDQTENLEFIRKNYEQLVRDLETRKAKLPRPFVEMMQELINDAHIAYKTLTKI